MANVGSNFLQLMANGVGARDIYRGFTAKLVEIDQHLKNLARKVEIEALMAVHAKDPIMLRKLKTELKSLEDSSRRMSIWPLIEAGEFSTISEGLTEQDAAIGQGKWADQIQTLMEKVPAKLGTVGRYATVARDTALFQGMARATQYGDFLAKAVLHEHLTKREGMKPEKAMQRITEAFVNYNLLPGRMRTGAEAMGITWFWAYKLRGLFSSIEQHLRAVSGLSPQRRNEASSAAKQPSMLNLQRCRFHADLLTRFPDHYTSFMLNERIQIALLL